MFINHTPNVIGVNMAQQKKRSRKRVRGYSWLVTEVNGYPRLVTTDNHEYSIVNLYVKNLILPTPLICVLKVLILALDDSLMLW